MMRLDTCNTSILDLRKCCVLIATTHASFVPVRGHVWMASCFDLGATVLFDDIVPAATGERR